MLTAVIIPLIPQIAPIVTDSGLKFLKTDAF
jgi:hypothetical protein